MAARSSTLRDGLRHLRRRRGPARHGALGTTALLRLHGVFVGPHAVCEGFVICEIADGSSVHVNLLALPIRQVDHIAYTGTHDFPRAALGLVEYDLDCAVIDVSL